jgi:Tol biopolymer transport system component
MWSIFSHDGHRIAFVWAGASLQEIRVAVLDGSTRTIWKQPGQDWMELYDWSPDGRQLLIGQTHYGTNSEMLLMSVDDGSVVKLKTQPTTTGRMFFSNDGRWIAHEGPPASGDTGSDIYLLSRDGAHDNPVVVHPADDRLLGWSADGARLYFTSDRTGVVGLWSIAIQDGHASGTPWRIKDEIGRIAAPLGITSRDMLFYGSTVTDIDIYQAELDLERLTLHANPAPIAHRYAGANSYPSWSPDGHSISYLSNPPNGDRILFVQPGSGSDKRFTPALAWFNRPQWLYNGLIAMTGASLSGAEGLYGIDPTTGAVRMLLDKQENETVFHGEWSRDGRFFFNRHADARQGIYRLDLQNRRKLTIYVPPVPWRVAGAALSPDGSELAFEEDDYTSAVARLTLIRVDGSPEPRELMRVSTGDRFPCCRPFAWSPDSRHLLVAVATGSEGTLWDLDVPAGKARRLPLSASELMNPVLSPDGKRLLYQAGETRFELWSVENIPASPR